MPPKKKQAVGPIEVAASTPSSKPLPQKNASTLVCRLEQHINLQLQPEPQAEAPVPAADPAKRKRTKTKVVIKEEPDVVKQDDVKLIGSLTSTSV